MSKSRGELTMAEVMKRYGYTADKLRKCSDSDPSDTEHLRNRQTVNARGHVQRYFTPTDVERWIAAQYR